VADALSREVDLSDDYLLQLWIAGPKLTKICPLPQELSLAAEMQRENGVTKNTRDKELIVWWVYFERDIWRKCLSPEGAAKIMGAFEAALQ
jgi:hypothetical protein